MRTGRCLEPLVLQVGDFARGVDGEVREAARVRDSVHHFSRFTVDHELLRREGHNGRRVVDNARINLQGGGDCSAAARRQEERERYKYGLVRKRERGGGRAERKKTACNRSKALIAALLLHCTRERTVAEPDGRALFDEGELGCEASIGHERVPPKESVGRVA